MSPPPPHPNHQPAPDLTRSVVREDAIESGFLGTLQKLKYEYRPDITNRASLEANFREKFEALNRVRLTDAEFARLSLPPLSRARMVDTVAMARRKYPGLPASLDALCRRFDIDLSQRTTHNALLDCRLLAQVYIELLGGRQPGLGLVSTAASRAAALAASLAAPVARTARLVTVTEEERLAHAAFLDRFVKEPVWAMFAPPPAGENE